MKVQSLFITLIVIYLSLDGLAQETKYSFENVIGTYSASSSWDGIVIEIEKSGNYSITNWSDLCVTNKETPNDCLNYDKEWGTFSIEKNFLKFSRDGFRSSKTEKRQQFDQLQIVSWSDRYYLIPPNRLLAFINSVNREITIESSRLKGLFFSRIGDERKSVGGLPQLPVYWENYLLKTPIEAKIIEIIEKNGKVFAKIDKGNSSGLKVGMQIGDDCAGISQNDFQIISINKTSSLVHIDYPRKIGNTLSTKFGDISKCVLDGVDVAKQKP